MATWADVSDSRLTAGRLWLPQLNLDCMGRDWASFTVPFDMQIDTMTQVGAGSSTVDVIVCFPDDWGIEQEYDPRAQITLSLYMTGQIAADSPPCSLDIGGDATPLIQTSDTVQVTRTWTATPPTGPQTYTLTLTAPVGTALKPNPWAQISRAFGWGPDCTLSVTIDGSYIVTTSTPSPPTAEEYTTSTQPDAGTVTVGTTILVKDSGAPGKYYVALKQSDNTQYWHLLAIADPI